MNRSLIFRINFFVLGVGGEWYTELTYEGTPVEGVPKVFFWKSLYHTVRYYDYLVIKVKV